MHGRDAYARVNYTLSATLVVAGGGQPILSASREFFVNQVRTGEVGARSNIKKTKVSSFCCLSKGEVSFAAHIEKPEYTAGEDAYMIAEVDNSQCKADIKAIRGIHETNYYFKGSRRDRNL